LLLHHLGRKKPVPQLAESEPISVEQPVSPPKERLSDVGLVANIIPSKKPLKVSMVWTRSATDLSEWHRITLESLFLLHPNSQVTVYSNTLTTASFQRLIDEGFHISVEAIPMTFFDDTPLRGNPIYELCLSFFFYSYYEFAYFILNI
jgi:hypothetical protein